MWSSITFWEYTFVADVQREICRLYQVKNISHSSRRSQIIDDSMLEGKKVFLLIVVPNNIAKLFVLKRSILLFFIIY